MRVFIASVATETNTFAPFPTGWSAFQEYGVRRDASLHGEGPMSGPLKMFRQLAQAAGDEVIESISAFAQPSGRTLRAVYESLRDQILDDLKQAGAVDLVLLTLHGAMVADGYDDCEGDLLMRVRALAPRAVIGVELDLHCQLTKAMVREADFLIPVKEYPHTDFGERAVELFQLCRRAARGEIDPVAALVDTCLVGLYPTTDLPMSAIVADLYRVEQKPGVLSASIAHGFPWGDVKEGNARVLVYADADARLAIGEAQEIARRMYESRRALQPVLPDIPASLERVTALEGRIVLGDFADNPGGGAPGDSTFFLQALVHADWRDVALGFIWDPMAVNVCAEAGAGARLPLRLGGKSGRASGMPLDLDVEVIRVVDDHRQTAFGMPQPMGRSAWVRVGGIDVGVCSLRTQVYEPDAFTGLGMSLTDKRLIVVKSSTHYQAGFRSLADHLWHVASPGAISIDFAKLDYTRRDLEFFPRSDDPWASFGAPEPTLFSRRDHEA